MDKPTVKSRKATLADVNYSFVRMSGNKKTGFMPAGYSSFLTCWPGCTFGKHGACYGKGGHCQMHMHKVTSGARGITFAEYCDQIRILPDFITYRPMVAGDLPGLGGKIDECQMVSLILANKNRRGDGSKNPIGYSHAPVFASQAPFAAENARLIKLANSEGFTVNLSADTAAQADDLVDLGIGPVVCVLPKDAPRKSLTPKGRKILGCPAVFAGLTCESCRLCAKSKRRFIVGFPAHGMRFKIADKIARGELT
jgi:hypothetical protein